MHVYVERTRYRFIASPTRRAIFTSQCAGLVLVVEIYDMLSVSGELTWLNSEWK